MADRREFLSQAAATVAVASFLGASKAQAADKAPAAAATGGLAAVVNATADCIKAGENCVAHCTEELGKGNKDMASCNRRVHEMLAACRAMLTLAASGSEFAKRLAPICADACKACAAACAEHKDHWGHGMHLACKACHEACLACEKACRAA